METGKTTGGVPMVKIDGAKVRNIRESKGLTQLFLATAVGVTTDTISRWENKRYPTIKKENAVKLAEALEVELDAILEIQAEDTSCPSQTFDQEQERKIADTDAAEELKKPVRGAKLPTRMKVSLAAVILIPFLALLGWWFSADEEPVRITAKRILPHHAVGGQPFPVSIAVASNAATAVSLIVRENLPEGTVLLSSAPPYSAYDAKTGELKWLKKIDGSQIFAYLIKIDRQAGTAVFAGKVALPKGSGPQIDVSGNAEVQMSHFHWADTDADNRISDEEILTVYDEYSEIKNLAVNIDQVEEIWLGSGYIWDPEKQKFNILP